MRFEISIYDIISNIVSKKYRNLSRFLPTFRHFVTHFAYFQVISGENIDIYRSNNISIRDIDIFFLPLV